jgi:hypothetical protein
MDVASPMENKKMIGIYALNIPLHKGFRNGDILKIRGNSDGISHFENLNNK